MRYIFSREISPSCEYCRNSKSLSAPGEMLCSKQGVVKSDYACKQFKYDPLKRKPKRRNPIGRFSQEEFVLD